MATRWEDRVRAAEQLRFESSLLGKALAALGISNAWMQLRFGKRGLFRLGWAVVPRTLKLVAGAVAVTWVIMVVAAISVVVFVFFQLA